MKTMKTLYFEGAGWSGADISRATVGNCRIRTAFRLDDGRPVYLELNGFERGKKDKREFMRWRYTGVVDECHYITDDLPNDDCNLHRVPRSEYPSRTFEYSEAGILAFVNGLGASFDAVKVVPDYGDYQVFKVDRVSGGGTLAYNYGDEFHYDADLTARRAAKVAEMKKLNESRFHRRYDNSSYWVRGGKLFMWLCVSADELSRAGISQREFELDV